MVAFSGQVPFVGRQRELSMLAERLDSADQGKGSLVLVAGEAGIGKTSLLEVFAERACDEGKLVLHGRCTEGEWAPPYGPWVEALGDYAQLLGPEKLRSSLGAVAPVLARTVPAIAAALPDLADTTGLKLEDELVRLYDAVARWLLALAQPRAAILVLEDLQWADRGSLRMLQYVARSSRRSRLLIVGSYRDVEIDANNTLAQALPALAHEPGFERIVLAGLSEADITGYISRSDVPERAVELAPVIHAETGGNPFFVRELLRHSIEQTGPSSGVTRPLTAAGIVALGVPKSVQDVVNHRLARLADETKRMLTTAAAFDGCFSVPVLEAVTKLPEEALLDAIDEAQQAGVIREDSGQIDAYAFAHAILRHALYDQLSGSRRLRLHRQIAEVLAQLYAGQEDEHAAELAAHYYASSGLPGAEAGLAYALTAADEALTAFGPERAVSLLRMARILMPAGEKSARADILCRLALAEADALLPVEALDTLEEALAALAEGGAEPTAVGLFLANIAGRLKDGGAGDTAWTPLVERGIALLGNRHDLTWARLKLVFDPIETVTNEGLTVGHWLGYGPEAVAIARVQGTEEDYAATLHVFDWTARAETEAIIGLARTWQSPAATGRACWMMEQKLLYSHGAIREAGAVAQQLLEAAERVGSLFQQVVALGALVVVRVALGDFAEAQEIHARIEQILERLGANHWLRFLTISTSFQMAYYKDGDWQSQATMAMLARDAMPRAWLPTAPAHHGQTALACIRAGQAREAERILDALTPILEVMKPTAFSLNSGIGLAAAAMWEQGATSLAPRYLHLALDQIAAGTGNSPVTCNELTVARMAALSGDLSEAQTYFARARDLLDANGQRPLRAVAAYDEALALARCGSKDSRRTLALLDEALAEFAVLGMEGWTGRGRDLRESIQGGGYTSTRYPDGLTAREIEVLRLIAAGRSNAEIAADLVLSERTVGRHITNIYTKIGARNRVDAANYFLRRL